MKIFLMGMPGSGKSTAGKKLAARLSFAFTDLDKFIEEKYQANIAQLFSQEGEAIFREKEKACLEEVAAHGGDRVIALGGGTPCFHTNLSVINAAGISVYLKMPAAALLKRILQGAGERPMFRNMNEELIQKKLVSLLAEREQFYSQAHITVHAADLDIAQLAARIKEFSAD